MNRRLKLFIYITVLLLLFYFSFKVTARNDCQNKIVAQTEQDNKPDTIPKEDTIIVVGVGDIMLGTDYPSEIYLPPSGSCVNLLKDTKPSLIDADITFGNLEGTFSGSFGKPKECNNPKYCYVFRMPERFVDCLADAGFDLLSAANNHSHDFGYEGIRNTARTLEKAGIGYAGTVDKPYEILVKNEKKFGFCAFAPNSGTSDINDLDKAISLVRYLDTISDIVIVSFHGGAEGKDYQYVTMKSESFLGQNRGNVYEFAHKVIDAGADIVFGHGPHVTRAIEIYKSRFIIYSLGNFCTYARINLEGPNGIAPIMKLFVDANGKFLKGLIIPTFQEGEGIPHIDPQGKVIKKLQELTLHDFPQNNLIIQDDGSIYNNNP